MVSKYEQKARERFEREYGHLSRAEQVAKVRAEVEEGKRLCAERFEREFGVPLNRENAERVIRRAAHLAAEGRTTISKADL